MIESLPDFEAQTAPEGTPPARKPRRKPTKKRSARSPTSTDKPARKPRGKIDKRTKAYRLKIGRVGKQVVRAEKQIFRVDMRQATAPVVAGQAQTVLAILALVSNFTPEVRKQILSQAGALA